MLWCCPEVNAVDTKRRNIPVKNTSTTFFCFWNAKSEWKVAQNNNPYCSSSVSRLLFYNVELRMEDHVELAVKETITTNRWKAKTGQGKAKQDKTKELLDIHIWSRREYNSGDPGIILSFSFPPSSSISGWLLILCFVKLYVWLRFTSVARFRPVASNCW